MFCVVTRNCVVGGSGDDVAGDSSKVLGEKAKQKFKDVTRAHELAVQAQSIVACRACPAHNMSHRFEAC